MHHDDSGRHHATRSDGTTRAIATRRQWHDAELAMTVARHSVGRWLATGYHDTPSPALMHAYHAHTALHEAARAMLTEPFRADATALITTPAQGTDIPPPTGDHAIVGNAPQKSWIGGRGWEG